MDAETQTARSSGRLIRCSVAYLVWASLATAVAIAQDRPAEFGGATSGLPVWKDFVFGMGTALSPALWWMVLHAIVTVLVGRSDRAGRVGVISLTVVGALEFVGAMGEPITLEVLRPATFDPLLAVIQLGMIALPLGIAAFGAL